MGKDKSLVTGTCPHCGKPTCTLDYWESRLHRPGGHDSHRPIYTTTVWYHRECLAEVRRG